MAYYITSRILEVDSWPDHLNPVVSLPTLSSSTEDF